MNFELNGMEELNEQELMMVDGGRWNPRKALGLICVAITCVAGAASNVNPALLPLAIVAGAAASTLINDN